VTRVAGIRRRGPGLVDARSAQPAIDANAVHGVAANLAASRPVR
jgi:hypothetical protein